MVKPVQPSRGSQTFQKVKTAKGRKISSTRWLERQLNDPYVAEAKRMGYRSRAAFKLIEMDDKLKFFKPGQRIIDLGAAPGGWTQVAVDRVKSLKGKGIVVGLDIQEIEAIQGATLLCQDFLEDEAPGLLTDALGGPADVVLSDMAPFTTGHTPTDHMRIMGMCEVALDFAADVLVPGGVFVAKVFQGGTERDLLTLMKRLFKTVKHVKPPSSRKESAELYVVSQGFKGRTS